MSVTIFARQAGRVLAFTDPALPSIAAVTMEDFGGFTSTRSIVTRVGFSGQSNANFRHTIGGAVHIYTFGDRIGAAEVHGLCFDNGCGGNAFHGLREIIKYYDRNRVSQRRLPIKLTIGSAVTLRSYLLNVQADVGDTKARVYQYVFKLAIVPAPQRKTKEQDDDKKGKSEAPTGAPKKEEQGIIPAGDLPEGAPEGAGDEDAQLGDWLDRQVGEMQLPPLDMITDLGGASGAPSHVPLPAGGGYANWGTGPQTQLSGGFNY